MAELHQAAAPYVFLSYASIDRDRALRIADAIEGAGIPVWIDRQAIAGGTSWGSEIVEGIKGCGALLICCTPAAMASRNVRQEIQLAWRYERAYLPFLLEPMDFPEQVQYFLEGWQWVELAQRSTDEWLPAVSKALARLGVARRIPLTSAPPMTVENVAPVSGAEPVPQAPLRQGSASASSGLFAGRTEELARLQRRLDQAAEGAGGLVVVPSEPGVGKTRLLRELAAKAVGAGAVVLWGQSYEGDVAPPYGPWVEALSAYARTVEPEQLRRELAATAPLIARLVPAVRAVLPEVLEPPVLGPEEERFRLHDAVAQFVLTLATARPLLLVLDDLHWADRDSVSLLRHLARLSPATRLLVVGLYRDVDLDRQHPLATALAELRRQDGFERLALRGLRLEEVNRLLAELAGHAVAEAFATALFEETEGNPFFLREVLLHLQEEGRIVQQTGRWTATVSLAELGIPEGVREVVGRRLSRLSAETNRVLGLASAFTGGWEFGLLQDLAGASEDALLNAVDEALAAQVIRPLEGKHESYDFVHALIRRTLYDELNPSRKVRLHRQIADTLERRFAGQELKRADELAFHFHQSAVLPGAERGLPYCLAAAERAEGVAAWSQAAVLLRWALELLSEADERRGRLLARLATDAAWALEFDAAVEAATQAGEIVAQLEGDDAAANYLADAVLTFRVAGGVQGSFALARQGLRYVGARRDDTWAALFAQDLVRQETEDPANPGLPLATPERESLWAVTAHLPPERGPRRPFLFQRPVSTRAELAAQLEAYGTTSVLGWWQCGEYRRALDNAQAAAEVAEAGGQINTAVASRAWVARCRIALGDLPAAEVTLKQARALRRRLGSFDTVGSQQLDAAYAERTIATGRDWERIGSAWERASQARRPEFIWTLATVVGVVANARGWLGSPDAAVEAVRQVLPALEGGPAGSELNYTAIACDAASGLWFAERTDHIEVVERCTRTKVVEPDFRYPMRDGRLSLARLCALQGRYDEATDWFAEARRVLAGEGSLPLLAVCDFDEAVALRHAGSGNATRIQQLLADASKQFEALGMPGWLERASMLGDDSHRSEHPMTI